MKMIKTKCCRKRKFVAIFFRFIPIDSMGVLLYACNGTLYHNHELSPEDSFTELLT